MEFYHSSRCSDRLIKKISPLKNKVQWIYFGTNIDVENELIKVLGNSQKYAFAGEFNYVANNCREKFIDAIGDIANANNPFKWYATIASYKSPLASDLFQNYCFERLVYRWKKWKNGPNLIFIEDKFLYFDLMENHGRKSSIFVLKKQLLKKWFSLKNLLEVAIWVSIKLVRQKKYSEKNRIKVGHLLKKSYSFGILTWVDHHSFSSDVFVGRYLKNLYPFIEKNNKSKIIFTHSEMDKHAIDIAIHNDIIPLCVLESRYDYLVSLYHKFTQRIKVGKRNYLCKYLRNSFFKSLHQNYISTLQFYLFFSVFKKLLFTLRIDTKKIIYPFENQPYEKMMILANQKLKMNYMFVGYQHASIPANYVNYFNSKIEKKIIPSPDVIVSNGKLNKSILNTANFSSEIVNGGSLRGYTDKLNLTKCIEGEIKPEDNVLVLLNYDDNQALQTLRALQKCNSAISFLIKAHPNQNVEMFKSQFKEIPMNFLFVKESIDQLLKRVRLVIHNGTTAAFECVDSNLPILNFITNSLSLDALGIVFSEQYDVLEEDMVNIEKFFREVPRKKRDSALLEKFNDQNWRKILLDRN